MFSCIKEFTLLRVIRQKACLTYFFVMEKQLLDLLTKAWTICFVDKYI